LKIQLLGVVERRPPVCRNVDKFSSARPSGTVQTRVSDKFDCAFEVVNLAEEFSYIAILIDKPHVGVVRL
jgi:hypothetical protein